jgi:ribosomal protein S13
VEDDKAVRAGWEQIPGIGAKMSQRIAEGPELDDWDDLAAVKGVGPKTVEKIREFVAAEDPFQIQQIEKAVTAITGDLEKGIEDQHGNKLPVPTHDGFHISMEKPKTKVVFLGQPVQRHIRDLFEQNRAKTGVELDPKTVSRPDMSQWLTIMLKDADGFMVWAVVSRFKYPSLKEMLWSFKLGSSDMLLIKAKKSATVGWEGGAMLSVDHLWVVEA